MPGRVIFGQKMILEKQESGIRRDRDMNALAHLLLRYKYNGKFTDDIEEKRLEKERGAFIGGAAVSML